MRGLASDVIVKIVTLFLIFIAVLAMFGKLRLGNLRRAVTGKCKTCGRYRIGKGPCDCSRKRS